MTDPRLIKLLRLAIHPGTSEHEGDNAMRRFRSICIKDKMTAEGVMAGGSEKIVYVDRIVPVQPQRTYLAMPFGKYKGKNLDELLRDDSNYCLWAIKNVERMNPAIRSYLKSKLGVA